jgi:6-phosphofructokinase 1
MVALAYPNVNHLPLADVAGRMKAVPMEGDTV